MPENMKKEITVTHNIISSFFLTFLGLCVAWPFLTNENLSEALFLDNKKAAPQEETLLFPLSPLLPVKRRLRREPAHL